MEVTIAPRARSDIATILAWTEESFGTQTVHRYGMLIANAIEQVAENPEIAGSIRRPEIAKHCLTYLFTLPNGGGGVSRSSSFPRAAGRFNGSGSAGFGPTTSSGIFSSKTFFFSGSASPLRSASVAR